MTRENHPCRHGLFNHTFFTSQTDLTLKNISQDKKVAYSFKGRGNETGISLKGQKKVSLDSQRIVVTSYNHRP